jgi:hypothetical protein
MACHEAPSEPIPAFLQNLPELIAADPMKVPPEEGRNARLPEELWQ